MAELSDLESASVGTAFAPLVVDGSFVSLWSSISEFTRSNISILIFLTETQYTKKFNSRLH